MAGGSRFERRRAEAEAKAHERRLRHLTMTMMGDHAAQRSSGAGYPVDTQLRLFLNMFSSAVLASFGADKLKHHFGHLDGFMERKALAPEFAYLRLRQEVDHAFSSDDFLDVATSGAISSDVAIDRLRHLPEGVIHNYTGLGDVHGNAFHDAEGRACVFSGISLVRHADSLHWVMVGGHVCDLGAESDELMRPVLAGEVVMEDHAGPVRDYVARALPLPGTEDVWETAVWGLFNLRTRAHESRSISRAISNGDHRSDDVHSDDPVSLGMLDLIAMTNATPGLQMFAERSMALLGRSATLFEIAETCFRLPAYFDMRIGLVLTTRRETLLGRGEVRGEDAQNVRHASEAALARFRKVRTLEVMAPSRPASVRKFTPPRFRVELEGFWRRLSTGSVGRDRDGNPEPGRTWVVGHVRWRDKPPRTGTIAVKSLVLGAMRRATDLAEGDPGQAAISLRFD